MKTAREWFHDLPEPYRSQAIENIEIGARSIYRDSLADALINSFYWDETTQGNDYWERVYNLAYDGHYSKSELDDTKVKVKLDFSPYEERVDKSVNITTLPHHPDYGDSEAIQPDHYGGKDNPYEAIKVIKAHDLNFCLGNVIKYVLRAGKKGDRAEDLRKAIKYLEMEIEIES